MTQFTIQHALKLLKINANTFPAFFKGFDEKSALELAQEWQNLFCDTDAELVIFAFRQALKECEYPVTPAEVTKRIDAMQSALGPTATELWDMLDKASDKASDLYSLRNFDIGGSKAHREAQAIFDALPAVLREFCHDLKGLVRMSEMEYDAFHTYKRQEFIKQLPKIKERAKLLETTPPALLALVQTTTKAMDNKLQIKGAQE